MEMGHLMFKQAAIYRASSDSKYSAILEYNVQSGNTISTRLLCL